MSFAASAFHRRTGTTCRAGVAAFLREHTGTIAEMAALLGFAKQTVENQVVRLRHQGSDLPRNVVDGRKLRKSRPFVVKVKVAEIRRQEVAATIVVHAMLRRTPLEQVWGASA